MCNIRSMFLAKSSDASILDTINATILKSKQFVADEDSSMEHDGSFPLQTVDSNPKSGDCVRKSQKYGKTYARSRSSKHFKMNNLLSFVIDLHGFSVD